MHPAKTPVVVKFVPKSICLCAKTTMKKFVYRTNIAQQTISKDKLTI